MSEDANERSAESIAELGAELRSAIGRSYRRFRSARSAGELGDAAVGVLAYLQRNGPQTLTALSERDRVTPGSMSQTVNRLASAGLVVRTPDPRDGRRVLFSTTERGDAAARETRAIMARWFDEQLVELPDEDLAALRRAAAVLLRLADG